MVVLRLGSDNCSGGAVPRLDAYSCVQKVTIALAVKLADVLVMVVTRTLSLRLCSNGGSCVSGCCS
jgi:hypothetical protein